MKRATVNSSPAGSEEQSSSAGRERVLDAILTTGLCLITDDRLDRETLLQSTRAAFQAGVRLLQLRDKRSNRRQYFERAREIRDLCHEFQAAFVVNDYPDVARVLNADGIHVGQDDLPPRQVREIVGPDMAIGLSISYVPEAREAQAEGIVDYIGCGAVYPTATKPDAEFGGLDLVRTVRGILRVPILGIGGITSDNLDACIGAGADGVALVSAVYSAPDPALAARIVLDHVAAARASR